MPRGMGDRCTERAHSRAHDGGAMATITNDELEAEARAMLRDQIEGSAWFRSGTTPEERRAAIDLEVELWWHLRIPDAAGRLIDHAVGSGPSPAQERLRKIA